MERAIRLVLVVACASAAACDRGPSPSSAPARAMAPDASAPARGALLIVERGCPACHDPGDGSLAGQTVARPGTRSFGGNLTPDRATGIGGWTDYEIVRAIRDGLDDERQPLCDSMPRYALADDDAAAIVSYLRGLAPVENRDVPASICGPVDGEEGGDGGREIVPAFADAGAIGPPPALDGGLLATPDGGSPAAVDGGAPATSDGGAAPASDPDRLDGGGAEPSGDGGAIAIADLGPAATDLARATGDALVAAGDLGACAARINEVRTAGPGGAEDEFIEVVNPCPSAADLGGWRLVYRSSAGAKDLPLASLSGILLPGARLVAGGKGYASPADFHFTEGLAAAGAGLALLDAGGVARDSLAWGKATNALVRGRPAPAPPSGKSLAREPDGENSDDNARDFIIATPTPDAPNP